MSFCFAPGSHICFCSNKVLEKAQKLKTGQVREGRGESGNGIETMKTQRRREAQEEEEKKNAAKLLKKIFLLKP